ncbi:putative NRPS-like enzyme [Annulohypoxylon maeteangense]|uniref:putative NRPS-like enzyme n=1 Tax=Annulohypoxylon maeteangense TaxID=1927788 RepID=UPI0020085637|nr:putative NRPS-like enzyme [Annulohypoxylon maeteangense]KAI0883762.1 putative NRPS-like enzyme [Annulohypoxylon maeteangense]
MVSNHERVARWQDDLMPHIIDRLARETPDAVYGLWPIAPDSYEAGFRTVTYAQLANVINGLAWWLIQELGPSERNEVLTYVGPNDVRLTALLFAAIKAGYVLFLTSPRNSAAAHRGLFDALNCRNLVTTDPRPPSILPILEAVNPRQLITPSVEELLEKSSPHFILDKTFDQTRWDPFFIVHTSGSTGLPKPLIWTHESVTRHQKFTSRDPPDGVTSIDQITRGKRVIATLPPFHGAGLGQYLFYAVPFGNILIAPVTTGIVTAQGLVDALKHAPADIAVLAPSVVAELAQNPELLEYCASQLELIIFIGGDLPQAMGDRVAEKIRLSCQWGASEVGIPQQLIPAEPGRSDWHYTRFHPCTGAVFEEVADGTYELVIRRDEALADTQPAFSIRGQEKLEKEYRTKDLFERYPTVADAWRWRARADDIIVFLNGEKTNPVSMEQHIVARNPELSGVLVVGSQRFQAVLLIEPVSQTTPLTTADQAALIERIWPSVEEANRAAPAHARVEKTMILVTTADRPLMRAGKGTIQRAASLAQYAADIDKLYADVDVIPEDEGADGSVQIDTFDSVKARIREGISTIMDWPDIDDSTGFFERGMDSLQALRLTRALRRALRRPNIALSTVYQNSTIAQLASALVDRNAEPNERLMMEPILATYRALIHQIPAPTSLTSKTDKEIDVLLTGSTGTLGTHILAALLARPGIGHIFCLNRSQDGGRSVQTLRFTNAGLPSSALETRVTFIKADLAHPTLGLDTPTYSTLRSRVTLIIHNAWPVNFNLPLSAFRPHLSGLVNLLILAANAAPRTVHTVFISSVGAVGARPGSAPEAVLKDNNDGFDAPAGNGYSRSKFLAELLCDEAARHLRVPVTVVRVGQVAGAVRGAGVWNRAEWFPSLVLSSLAFGCLPESLGPLFSEVDWVPVDLAADVVVELAGGDGDGVGASVFNLRNPKTASWDVLVPAIREVARERLGRRLDVVSSSAWLGRLREAAANADADGDLISTATSNPAIKLVSFYSNDLWADEGAGSKLMSVERALRASSTLRDMSPVGVEWMRKWVHEWISAKTQDGEVR